MEAAWRILGMTILSKSPAVIRLPVHLERRQLQAYLRPHKPSMNKLLHYFARPRGQPFADLTYIQYREQYSIARLANQHPAGEYWLEDAASLPDGMERHDDHTWYPPTGLHASQIHAVAWGGQNRA